MKRFGQWSLRVFWRFWNNNCTMHAAGLTYFALLAVVPVLCCVLVAAKACRVDEYARTQINARIDALIESIEDNRDVSLAEWFTGESSEERQRKELAAHELATTARQVSDQLFSRIERFDVGTLGWIGFGFLLWTVISSLASVETSFNEIFDIRESRPFWKRVYMYLFILVIMPILATVAMSVPVLGAVKSVISATLGLTYLTKWLGDWLIWILDSWCFRFVLTFAASTLFFSFFFWIIPNCRVQWRAALYGGMFTALVFGGWMKICTLAQVGIARSSALYGSFAFLPMVLAWLYVSWQIVLAGACIVKESEK